MNKLQIVTDKIYNLLKDTHLPIMNMSGDGVSMVQIREAEVLMAFGKLDDEYKEAWIFDFDGEFISLHENTYDVMEVVKRTNINWQLGQPLSSQSPETIEFLFTVLNCEV